MAYWSLLSGPALELFKRSLCHTVTLCSQQQAFVASRTGRSRLGGLGYSQLLGRTCVYACVWVT